MSKILQLLSKKTSIPIRTLTNSTIFISGFNIVAEVTKSKRGYPRIYYDGHHYGFKTVNSSTTVWLCTGSLNKRRCTASIQSKNINGIEMMKIQNRRHFCDGETLLNNL